MREHPGEPTPVIVNGRDVWPVAVIQRASLTGTSVP
jgi:hypothetical protein